MSTPIPQGLKGLPLKVAMRLIDIAAADQEHQRSMDDAEIELAKRGQFLAAALSIFFGVVAVWVTLEGHDAVGGTIAGTTIVAIASAFIIGRKQSA